MSWEEQAMKWSDFLTVFYGERGTRNKMFTNEFSLKIKSKSQIKGQEFKLVDMLKEISVSSQLRQLIPLVQSAVI